MISVYFVATVGTCCKYHGTNTALSRAYSRVSIFVCTVGPHFSLGPPDKISGCSKLKVDTGTLILYGLSLTKAGRGKLGRERRRDLAEHLPKMKVGGGGWELRLTRLDHHLLHGGWSYNTYCRIRLLSPSIYGVNYLGTGSNGVHVHM